MSKAKPLNLLPDIKCSNILLLCSSSKVKGKWIEPFISIGLHFDFHSLFVIQFSFLLFSGFDERHLTIFLLLLFLFYFYFGVYL
jgi:hypothetical protein